MIEKNIRPGTPVEVQFRDHQWHGGYTFVQTCGAMDRDYRVVVESNHGEKLVGIDPACVRVEK